MAPCSTASAAKRAHQLGHVDLLLVDEAHLISPSEQTLYRKLIDELRRYCPALRVIGWTGTAFRGDGIWLTQHGLFTHVAARVTMGELLRGGYLAPLVAAQPSVQIDTEGVRTSGGDYVVSALAAASDKAEIVTCACAEIVRLAAERRRWLIFAVTVEHAVHIASELRHAHGIACEVISAKTPKSEREARIAAFHAGHLRALVNVAVLTTGFDAPEVDCIALLRATKSPVLYVQIAGRGMRTAPGKTDCLWLDFTTTTASLGPVDAIKGRAKPKPRAVGEAVAPVRTCDACGNPSPAGCTACLTCGAIFPDAERITHSAKVSLASPLAATGPQWHSISRVGYRHHHGRDGKPDTLRVDYFAGLRLIASEWVCVEHTGYARAKAEAWWSRRSREPTPRTAADALTLAPTLIQPGRIQVRQGGKYPEVIAHEFNDAAQPQQVPSAQALAA